MLQYFIMSFSLLLRRSITSWALLILFAAVFIVYAILGIAHAENHEESLEFSPPPDIISDEEIALFLFRINEETKSKVVALDGNKEQDVLVPVLFGVAPGDIENTWGYTRSGGRMHTGADIVVPRGELVVSPTEAVVTKVGYDNKGGNYVITANPGGEQFYYAHLDAVAEDLIAGSVLVPGDLIGYVGNTGNARDRAPHLHFSIYYRGIARDPHPRLTHVFTLAERIDALERILNKSNGDSLLAVDVVENSRERFERVESKGLILPQTIATILENREIITQARFIREKLAFESEGAGVHFLQQFLIQEDSGPHSRNLASVGATGYFGSLTRNALAEYQDTAGIAPARGYFGPITRASVFTALLHNNTKLQKIVETEASQDEGVLSQSVSINRDLETGSLGEEVGWLQNFLIQVNSGPYSRNLASVGATGYFGSLTRNALAEYQDTAGIAPARGYFGPITRAKLHSIGVLNSF